MKYYKATFNIKDTAGRVPADTELLQTAKDVLCAIAAEAGFEAFEEFSCGVFGYVQQNKLDREGLASLQDTFPIEGIQIACSLETAEYKDWNLTWEKLGFESIVINGKCVIHDAVHPIPAMPLGAFDITIDAHQAFGTGTHETTKMIVGELSGMDLHNKKVLDCGCGTGILSIVAEKMGALEVTAYDIDEWSVENTRHNCRLNNTSHISVTEGDSSVITSLKGGFNVILANINRNILLADMPRFKNIMATGGMMIMSGFYTEDAPMIIAKATGLGLRHIRSVAENNWCMTVFTTIKT